MCGQIDGFCNITFVATWPDTMENILLMQGIVRVWHPEEACKV
jgi:hypothetical protein